LKRILFKLASRYHNRIVLAEVLASQNFKFQPLVVFAHGLNGFKDWGPFRAMGQAFAEAGFAFCSFNFSHNGTTPESPTEFTDLEGYRENTFGIMLSDLATVLEFFTGGKSASEGILIDKRHIGLLGHSWGGSVCILETARNPNVKALVTLAAQASFSQKWTVAEREEWAHEGVRLSKNTRTGQVMPLGYGLLEELEAYPDVLNPLSVAGQVHCPWMIVHGEKDETVPLADGLALSLAQPQAETLWELQAGHTFGEKHPFGGEFSAEFRNVLERTIRFFQTSM
jgi:uncharacterized protein